MDLNKLKAEYINLGKVSGLFDEEYIRYINYKLSAVKEIVINNDLPGDAFTRPADGIIEINIDKCSKKGETYLDEVLFHEFSHFINEFHSDLYVRKHRFNDFCNSNSNFGENDILKKNPLWGVILLDEVVAQNISQIMVELKYNITYENKTYYGDLSNPPRLISNNYADYPDYVEFAEGFVKTIIPNGSIEDLSKLAVEDRCVDKILSVYCSKKNGNRILYDALSYMGNIVMADYVKKGFYQIISSDEHIKKENIYKSMYYLDDIFSENKVLDSRYFS